MINLGAGIFVTTIIAGSIFISVDFKAMERPLARDIVFYVAATYLGWFIFYREAIEIEFTVGFICLYLFYIFVVVGSGILYKRFCQQRQEKHVDNHQDKHLEPGNSKCN